MSQLLQWLAISEMAEIRLLVDWIRLNFCPDLGKAGAAWNHRHVLIFTEYTDTKRYLVQQLSSAIANSHLENNAMILFRGNGRR